MIAYKDFGKAKTSWFSSGPFETAVKAANEWIAANKVDVINVETINDIFGSSRIEGIGVRVWYRN